MVRRDFLGQGSGADRCGGVSDPLGSAHWAATWASGPEKPRGGRQCELCGGAYFSGRREPLCSGGQECPRAFGHGRGSVAWIDGRWVAVELLEEIGRQRRSAYCPPASTRAGKASGETARAGPLPLLDAPLLGEPEVGAGGPGSPLSSVRSEVVDALAGQQPGRAAGAPKPPPPNPPMLDAGGLPMAPPLLPPPSGTIQPGSSGTSGTWSGAGPGPCLTTGRDLGWATSPPTPMQLAEYAAAQSALAATAHLPPPCTSSAASKMPAAPSAASSSWHEVSGQGNGVAWVEEAEARRIFREHRRALAEESHLNSIITLANLGKRPYPEYSNREYRRLESEAEIEEHLKQVAGEGGDSEELAMGEPEAEEDIAENIAPTTPDEKGHDEESAKDGPKPGGGRPGVEP